MQNTDGTEPGSTHIMFYKNNNTNSAPPCNQQNTKMSSLPLATTGDVTSSYGEYRNTETTDQNKNVANKILRLTDDEDDEEFFAHHHGQVDSAPDHGQPRGSEPLMTFPSGVPTTIPIRNFFTGFFGVFQALLIILVSNYLA